MRPIRLTNKASRSFLKAYFQPNEFMHGSCEVVEKSNILPLRKYLVQNFTTRTLGSPTKSGRARPVEYLTLSDGTWNSTQLIFCVFNLDSQSNYRVLQMSTDFLASHWMKFEGPENSKLSTCKLIVCTECRFHPPQQNVSHFTWFTNFQRIR